MACEDVEDQDEESAPKVRTKTQLTYVLYVLCAMFK